MKSLDLATQLVDQIEAHGNIPVLLQTDAEGNYYEAARGVSITYLDSKSGSTFDSLIAAKIYGFAETDLTKVIVIFP